MYPHSLTILGLGAMGGSVAWQARRAGVPRVVGYSLARADAVGALRAGAVDEIADTPAAAAAGADFVVVATPPRAVEDLLPVVAKAGEGSLVTDIASVKAPVMRWAVAAGLADRFAGSHPFAGTHLSGWAGASPDRFRGVVVYVTATGPAGERAASEVMDFWRMVMDAEPVRIEAETHDTQLAWTSHLPQAVATALTRTVTRRDSLRGATWGRGIRDTTRIAASPSEAWVDVLLLNRQAVLDALVTFEAETAALRELLSTGDRDRLGRWLEEASTERREMDRPAGPSAVPPDPPPPPCT